MGYIGCFRKNHSYIWRFLKQKLHQYNQQDRACTFRCIWITIAAVEKQQVLHIRSVGVWSLFPSSYAHATYYSHLWPVWLCCIFPHYLINSRIWGGFDSLYNFFLISFFIRRIQWDTVINLHSYSRKVTTGHVRF